MRHRPIRGIRFAALPLAALLAVTACSPATDGGSTAGTGEPTATRTVTDEAIDEAMQEQTTLVVWTTPIPGWEAVEARFEEQYPSIDIVIETQAGGTGDQTLNTALEAGSGVPDVMLFASQDQLANFVLSDDVLDLTPYGAAELEPFYVPSAWDMAAYAGGVWGLPQDIGPTAVMYRQDLLQKAGYDEFPATWEEFAIAAEKVKETTGSYITNFATFEPLTLPTQGGAPLIAWDGETTLTIDTANDNVEAKAAFWADLIERDLVSVDPGFTDPWFQGLASGKYATWIGPAWGPVFLEGTAASSAGQWRVAPLPQDDLDNQSHLLTGGSQFSVMQDTKSPAAAYGFVRWLNGNADQFDLITTDLGLFPAMVDAIADDEWASRPSEFFGGQAINEVFAVAAEGVAPSPNPVGTYAMSAFADILIPGLSTSYFDSLQTWAADVATYAEAQGFTVVVK